MAVRGFRIKIIRSELCSMTEEFPAWECPLLEALHDQFLVVDEIVMNRDIPDTADEYLRLENKYPRTVNDDGSKGPPLVHVVYGAHAVGRKNLTDAINASVIDTNTDDLLGDTAPSVAA